MPAEHSVMVLLSPGARAGVPGIRNPDFQFLPTRMRGVECQRDPSAEGKGEHGWEELEAGNRILNSCNLKRGQELSFRW